MTNKYMYFIANWKMFGSLSSLNSLDKVINFLKRFKSNKFLRIIYCPPSTLIYPMSKKFINSKIKVGAQNCHYNSDDGPFTGEINPSMLKSVGASYIIIGHSENRRTGDNNKLINLKIKNSIKSGLKVVLCIGETFQEKKHRITNKVLSKQLYEGLKNIKNKKDIIIAYEPVWAIGTGLTPQSKKLSETIKFIKKKINKVKVLYGGSVGKKTIKDLKDIENLDGFLIGGSSQNPNKFIDIIKKTYN